MVRLAPLIFLAIAIAFFPQAALGLRTLFHYDTGLQNLAFRAWWFRELHAGHFATWCPGMFAGYPLFAETQTGPLYPPTFALFGLLPPTIAFSWSVILHFAAAGAGAFLLARRLGVAVPAAIFAGIAFELSGFLVTHVVHFNLLVGAAWAPWTAWLALRASDGRPRAGVFLAFALACQLLGAHPYAVLMNVLLAAVILAARAGSGLRGQLTAASLLAATVAVAVLLAAVQVLPARELIARTPRAEAVDWSFLTFGSFAPHQIATFLAPDVYGTPVNGTFWGGPDWSHYAETCAYSGALTLALAVAAIVLRRDLATTTFVAAGALSFLLMLGKYTPIYRLVAWIPIAQSTRLPARFALLLSLALAVLAALGLDALLREKEARRRRMAVAASAAFLVLLGWIAWNAGEPARTPDVAFRSTGQQWSARMAAIAPAANAVAVRLAIVAIASMLSLAAFLLPRVPRAAAALPVLCVLADLFSFGRDFNPTVSTAALTTPPPAVAALPDRAPRPRIFRQGLDEIWERGPRIPRTDFMTPAWKGHEDTYVSASWSMPPNSSLFWDVDSGEGFTSLPTLAWLEWMGLPAQPGAAPRPDLSEAQADLLAIDAVLSSGSGIAGENWVVQPLSGDLYLSVNRDPMPRVRWAGSWQTLPRESLLSSIRDPDYDPRRSVLVEDTPPGLPATRAAGRVDVAVEARELQAGRWRVEVPKTDGGLVVISESYDPDWIARGDDGSNVPVVRADGLFLAFPAPAAGGVVELSHAPRSVRRGAAISLAAFAIAVLAFVLLHGRSFPGLPSESRPVSRRAAWAVVIAPVLVVLASWIVDVGGARADRDRSSLTSAAVQSWSGEAYAALRAGAADEAVRLLRVATTHATRDAALMVRLGIAERAAGRPDFARDAFLRALAIDEDFAPAISALAEEESAAGVGK